MMKIKKIKREAKMLDLELLIQILENNDLNINIKAKGAKPIVSDEEVINKINELATLIKEKMILIGREIRKEEEVKNSGKDDRNSKRFI